MNIPNTIPPNDAEGLRMWLELLRGSVASLEATVKVLENKVKVLEGKMGGE